MSKFIFSILLLGLIVACVPCISAQEKKIAEPPKPASSPSQELSWAWNAIGGKLLAMAEDFPEDKYDFKAQQDERTFRRNLLHVAAECYTMLNAMKGSAFGPASNEDSLLTHYPSKTDIVKLYKQLVNDGAQLIKEQGDSTLTHEFKFPWGNFMAHGSLGWMSIIEHAGEHYGQLVVYYRVNGMIPPSSRPKK